ncbi:MULTISPECIES: preprotein translocase subunit SecY [Halorubrum]|jgi:preprotein translocase subunit SecY|uniref:Protein translocase subunit SecY n=1 Tax=Halorubrum tropicale TaxID=1765655 RepID=A0A0M9ASG7_9EURY|nr:MULTISPECIES: preprotein translocase subunit SecY [Halorubrum]KOX97842.1 preprotein translocase subunit SecY [Halorubrum tropicale]TKX43038.1 preprotein translocase subunit SecY [Halorubrum sp. ARQ200]TKX62273.1 preprotein translocase subunit SecY [Halorubrum sp. ASP1]
MSWKEAAEPVLSRMPVVERPAGHVPFKRKLTWTAGILIVYFFLTNINPFGLAVGQGSDFFGQFRSVLAGSSGSLLQVGIGPIVTASIVLQLLGGANLLGLDTENDPRDQVLYQGLQKLLVIIVSALTAAPMVFTGSFLPADDAVASALGIGTFGVQLLIFAQIFVGGILILFMDEIVSKWGVGSGVGLFIIASVSQQIVGGFFSFSALGASGFFASWYGVIFGNVPVSMSPFTAEGLQNLLFDPGNILALFTTVFIFGIVVYAESVRVEIPLSHARVKGARGRFPVKLIYASVLPMILVRALQANIQFLGQILSSQWAGMPAFLGEYSDAGQPISGLFYYLNPIQSRGQWMWFLGEIPASVEPWMIAVRLAVDLTFMIVGGAIFAIFWVETTGMGPEATAKQIQNSGMQIPGFRRNPQVVEKVMERYIPQVTVIGGALVGLLAVMANLLGTIGQVSGTGLLLAVSITYKLYEEIAEEQLMEMHPMMRQMFGNE